jgi:uncharacterized protein
VVVTGIIAGILWGAWHYLGNVAAVETIAGSLSVSTVLPLMLISLLVGWMPAFRVLMVWVYDRTGSLLVAILMHTTLTASIRIFNPLPNEGVPLLIYEFVLAAALWAVVGVVAVANDGHLSRSPLRQQVA